MKTVCTNPEWYLISEVELIYRYKVKPSLRPTITSTAEAFDILVKNWDENRIEYIEQFKIILLNNSNRVLGLFEVSSGGTSGTVADPKLIFAAALKANASGIILAHNHPSGGVSPSQADISITKKIVEAGKLLDIRVLDHLIVTPEAYYSFADELRI